MLSCRFKKAVHLELTFTDLQSPPFPKTHALMSQVLTGAAFKAHESYRAEVIFLLIAERKAAKETMFGANTV